MFRFRFGGKLWDMKRLPFGWKYSPVICQQLLGSLVRDLIPPDILLIHYLDDFLLVARDRARLREVTGRVAARLREAKFLVSPKSTLEPTDSLHCLGKFFDVEGGAITNSQFSLAKLVLAWLRLSVAPYTQRSLQSFMGSLQWAMQPRTGLGPMAAGSLAWVVWGSERCDGLPAGVGEALAQLIGHVMLPWRPAGGTLGWTLGGVRPGLGLGRLGGVLAPCGMGYDHPVLVYPNLFVDAAWDSLRGEEGYRVGLFCPRLGTRVEWLGTHFSLGSRTRRVNQQMAELWGVWTAVRLACHMGGGGGGSLSSSIMRGPFTRGCVDERPLGCGSSSGSCARLPCCYSSAPWWCTLCLSPHSCSRPTPCHGWKLRVGGAGRGRWGQPAIFGGGSAITRPMLCISGLWHGMWAVRWGR